MVHMGDVLPPGIRGDDDERYAETIHISRSPASAIIDDLWRWYMIVPSTPIIPGHDNGGIRPEWTVANGIDDRSYPRWTTRRPYRSRMVGVLSRRGYPSDCGKIILRNIG